MNNMNYYKESKIGESSTPTSSATYEKFNKGMVVITGIVGLISLIILIALNITNLSVNLNDKYGSSKEEKLLAELNEKGDIIIDDLTSNIKPRLSLITSATSYNLPTLINSAVRTIQKDLYQYCTPSYETDNGKCPVIENPRHDIYFKLYNDVEMSFCNITITKNIPISDFKPIPFASFIPTPTSWEGCVRFPTYSISSTIYSYSHNIIHYTCRNDARSSQYWSIGKIISGQNFTPVFKEIINWYLNDGVNRKYCSTVAVKSGAWLLCLIMDIPETADFDNNVPQDLFLGYMDVFGKRRAWTIKYNSINTDHPYNAIYTSVGSGVKIGDKIYFLIYGALAEPISEGAYCTALQCGNPNQDICNHAQRPGYYSGKQVLNALVIFDDNIDVNPILTIKTINPSQVPLGAEGRLYRDEMRNKTYIYVRSSTWHALLLFGELNLDDPITITFYKYTTVSRPSADPCSSANRCPAICVGGVYNDFFLLSSGQRIGVTLMLTGGKLRRGPQIRIADENNIYARAMIISQVQEAGYSTTSCFIYKDIPWCTSIFEIIPGAIGKVEIVSMMYPLPRDCFQGGPFSNLITPTPDVIMH